MVRKIVVQVLYHSDVATLATDVEIDAKVKIKFAVSLTAHHTTILTGAASAT